MVFEVYKDKAGEWRWRLVAGNHEIVADSAEGYNDKFGARAAAHRVRSGVGLFTPVKEIEETP